MFGLVRTRKHQNSINYLKERLTDVEKRLEVIEEKSFLIITDNDKTKIKTILKNKSYTLANKYSDLLKLEARYPKKLIMRYINSELGIDM